MAGAAILSIIVFLWFPAVDLWIAKWLYISSNTKPSMAYRGVYLMVPLLTAATLALLVFDICCMLVAKVFMATDK